MNIQVNAASAVSSRSNSPMTAYPAIIGSVAVTAKSSPVPKPCDRPIDEAMSRRACSRNNAQVGISPANR